MAAAAQVFAEKGFYRTTVEDITMLAGVGRGAFYHYFNKGKSDVAKAVVTEGFTMDAAVPMLPRIQSVVDASIALATLTPVVPVVKAAARLATEQDHPDFYGHLIRLYIPQVAELIEQAKELGELQQGVDPALTAEAWVMLYSGTDQHARLDYHRLPEKIATANAVIVRGIVTPETALQLDMSVARGDWLVRQSRWAEEYIQGLEAVASATGGPNRI
ncbi:helix-turn-helix domain containing protein [Streptomyces sp. ME02-6979.5a]|uniref:helix-turn-helix domain-containing protein n=1 Tax=Streptomyces sp. ME02-6979.5a TaxID=462925 RepID=UPI0029AC51FC|nr:helix-turn-helix domain-containing protein [Streptomyces sp. ME02-6979.5a]MDX3339684.1 helix-turn-helix domain containing protein [Streptomyces sp. ME02-6979.5a]